LTLPYLADFALIFLVPRLCLGTPIKRLCLDENQPIVLEEELN